MHSSQVNKLNGVMLISLFSFAAFYIAEFPIFKHLSLSPLIIGIILGMVYANSLRNHLPETWVPGIKFCTKTVLRGAIIFYGFRLTLQQVMDVGLAAVIIDVFIVLSVVLLGLLIGKAMKMDRDTTILTSVGSAICGAAAVLGTEPVLESKPHKTAVAVSTVVIFGTLAMFLYPALYRSGFFGLDHKEMGIYMGSTLHEVAHVAGGGNATGISEIADIAVIVKMIRVVLLAPVLLILSFFISRLGRNDGAINQRGGKITVPWFAIWFIIVIVFNTFLNLGAEQIGINIAPVLKTIENIDTFALTMAMCALGAETSFDKFKQAGIKPFILALILFVWLFGAGYLMSSYLPSIM